MNLTLFYIIFSIHSGILVITYQDVRDYSFRQLLHLIKNALVKKPGDVTSQDVTFYLFTKSVRDVKLSFESSDNVNLTKTTKMIIHGWLDNRNRSWYYHLTDEFLKKGDFNVIQVDWRRVAESTYNSAVFNIKFVAKYVATFILNRKLDPKKLHFVGHSLGAHISAIAAEIVKKSTGIRTARITGLDPAGPLFHTFLRKKKDKLDPEDAEVVDVIHTDGGLLGLYRPMGTFDIYINGGVRIQPDCYGIWKNISRVAELFENACCSHTRSYIRFIEIVNDYKYICPKCKSWTRNVMGLCNSNDNYVFGAEDINKTTTGVCFVRIGTGRAKVQV